MKNKPSVAKKAENEVAIKVENLSKTFKIPLEASNGIKQKLINTLKGVKGYREFTPLNDISFEINKGDFFGIVGRNGSGKSTLLKTMAGIYTPNAGSVTVNGSLVPFIELGVGFNPELTGRENVFLNGALLGFSHEEMEGMYQEIVDFAEIEEFMDEKLKNYSSGMQVRLAFSIAIQAKGDILLLDEVLAVGDEAFQRKCFNYFAELKREKKTVVLVTHSMGHVRQFCNKAALIDRGEQMQIGDPAEIANIYNQLNDNSSNTVKFNENENELDIKITPTFKRMGKHLLFDFNIETNNKYDDAVFTLLIHKDSGETVYRFVSDETIGEIDIQGSHSVRIELEDIFPVGKFTCDVSIKKKDRTQIYIDLHNIIEFDIINQSKHSSNTYWKPSVKYEYK